MIFPFGNIFRSVRSSWNLGKGIQARTKSIYPELIITSRVSGLIKSDISPGIKKPFSETENGFLDLNNVCNLICDRHCLADQLILVQLSDDQIGHISPGDGGFSRQDIFTKIILSGPGCIL